MLSLTAAADSITGERRLTTVLADGATDPRWILELAAHEHLAVSLADGDTRILVTGDPAVLAAVFGDRRIRPLLGAPHPVGDTGLHAPFVSPAEQARLDLSFRGILACARCSRGGRAGTWADDAARYVLLLTGPPGAQAAMRHVALPTGHRAFDGRGLRDGQFPGWITWAEMLTWRGQP